MQKKIRFTLFFCLVFAGQIFAQGDIPRGMPGGAEGSEQGLDPLTSEEDTVPLYMKLWTFDAENLFKNEVELDTFLNRFHISNPVAKQHFANEHLSVLGLASRPMAFYENFSRKHDYIFLNPYFDYLFLPEKTIFYNTNKPYTYLQYFAGGTERLKILHTQNVTPFLNFGFRFHTQSREESNTQKSTAKGFGFFANYQSERYIAHASYGYNRFEITEDGGIMEDSIEDNADFVPIFLEEARSAMGAHHIQLTQTLRFGKKIPVESPDTVQRFKLKPFASVSHSIEYTTANRLYDDSKPLAGFYQNVYIDSTQTHDSTHYRSLQNTIHWRFNENQQARFKLRGRLFAGHLWQKYYNFRHFILENNHTTHTSTFAGASIFDRSAKNWDWEATGKYFLTGYKANDFEIRASIQKIFRPKKDSAIVSIGGHYDKHTPFYLLQSYTSNHFRWENTFTDIERTWLHGEIQLPRIKLKTGAYIANLSNYIYFDTAALPVQESQMIQLLGIYGYKDFTLKNWHFNTRLIYQTTSDDAIRLPLLIFQLSAFYERTIHFKLTGGKLHFQFGIDAKANTSYNMPAFMPATGQFYQQNMKNTGDVPLLNVFLNVKIKKAFLSLRVAHLQNLWQEFYFPVLHYPTDEWGVRFGVSWRFHN